MDSEVPSPYFQEFATQMLNSMESLKTIILERLDAKLEKFYRQNNNPIQLGKVDEGNFNFPISSLPRGEGVGELKFPKSLPDAAPILEAVSRLSTFPVIVETVEPTTLPVKLEKKAEKFVFYQNQVALLYFFYEYEIPDRYLRVFLHLEDLLYDLYEFNISKFLSFGEKGVM